MGTHRRPPSSPKRPGALDPPRARRSRGDTPRRDPYRDIQTPPQATAAGSNALASGLPVNFFFVARRDGWRPRGPVAGNSVFHLDWNALRRQQQYSGTPWVIVGRGGGEVPGLTRAVAEGWQLALARLRGRVAARGAQGAIGVRLRRNGWDFASGLTEFAAYGTAVERTGTESGAGQPFVLALDGVELGTLRGAGYAPLGLVVGTCVSYVIGPSDPGARLLNGPGVNRPMRYMTEVVATCRSEAVNRMQSDARDLGAAGVVGVRLDVRAREIDTHNESGRFDHLIECTAFGTAVAASPDRGQKTVTAAGVDMRG